MIANSLCHGVRQWFRHRVGSSAIDGVDGDTGTVQGMENPMLFRKLTLPEYDIHHILSNPRRTEALEHINDSGELTLRELSEAVAASESGESPAPRNVREAVYVSLHQHHLPALHRRGIIHYDQDRKIIETLDGFRDVELYMEVVTKHGITWADYYRLLGVTSLLLVVVSHLSVPFFSAVPGLLWATIGLAVFAASASYQLWKNRKSIIRALTGGKHPSERREH